MKKILVTMLLLSVFMVVSCDGDTGNTGDTVSVARSDQSLLKLPPLLTVYGSLFNTVNKEIISEI